MKTIAAFGGGLAGACAVTLINESVKRIVPEAPRMDLLGMNAISKGLNIAGLQKSSEKQLFIMALAGDLIANSIYYSAAGIGKEKNVWLRSSILGLAAGIGAIALPRPLGLDERYSDRTTATKLMTVGLYVAGAVVTTAVIKFISHRVKKNTHKRNVEWERKLVTSAMG